MKKVIIILIIIVFIAAIALGCWSIFKNKNGDNGQVTMDSELALQIAQYKYENLLNYAQGNYMQLSQTDTGLENFVFDDKNYFKITDYDTSLKSDISDEIIEDFNEIAQIIEKDGNYYINVESIGREKNPEYESTIILLESFSQEEIVCEAQSTYVNYVSGVSNKITNEFVVKKIDGIWKVTKFELPY